MGQTKYEILKGKLEEIVTMVKDYPVELKTPAMNALVSALMMNEDVPMVEAASTAPPELLNGDQSSEDGSNDVVPTDWEEVFTECVDKYNLEKVARYLLATFVAYFFQALAPESAKRNAITKDLYEEACIIVGHTDFKTLSAFDQASRSSKKFLKFEGKKNYSLTNVGKTYVVNTMMKPKE